ncbi:hypothetical protein [Haloarcula limicola]|uniref:hypothetical protein n=1 Tax=Haloarcula limicola TaxID=1429915 RepID=UPI001F509062|nr:hypothetical protein [Halomicroarcula limicola]
MKTVSTRIEQAAEFSWRIDERIREVLGQEDLTVRQKQEIAETFSVTNIYEVKNTETVAVEK